MHRLLISVLMVLALGACNHVSTRPVGDGLPDTESIRYNLPYTHAKVAVTLTLKSCAPPITAAANATVTPIAAPSSVPEEQFIVSGPALQSFAKERDVSITLHENRAIKTVSSATNDKTPAIIGNVIKLATLFLAPGTAGTLMCTDDVKRMLTEVQALRDKIATLRAQQYDPNHSDDETVAKQINALATELARLNTGPLQVKLSKVVAIQPEIKAGYITWNQHHFRKWVEDPDNTTPGNPDGNTEPQKLLSPVPDFKLRYCIWEQGEDVGSCTTTLADRGTTALSCRKAGAICSAGVPAYVPDRVSCGSCPDTLVFREPVMAKFVLVASADNFVRAPDTTLASQNMPISQWGRVATLPMSVGFGGSKTVSVTLDAFGRRTAFGWKSGASGDAATGALATLGEQYVGFRDRDDGASLKEITDEATYLEAQQKLNRLEACREVIEAGGYVCPDSE